MTSALAAHARLLSTLPVREHRCEDDPAMPLNPPGAKRAVLIAGQRYASMKRAALAHGVSNHTIYRWLDEGRAQYA